MPDELPSPGAFNHVIVTFAFEGNQYWVDGTMSNQRGSLEEMAFPDFKWALVVTEDANKLTEIKPIDEQHIRAKINVEQELIIGSNQQPSELIIATEYVGWQAEQVRSYVAEVGLDATSKAYLDYLAKYFPGIQTKAPLSVEDSEKHNKVTIRERYSVNQLTKGAALNSKVFVPAHQILENIWLPNVRLRKAPFVLPYNLDVNVDIKISALTPSDLIWFDKKDITVEKNDWFNYQRTIKANDKVIDVNYQYSSLMPDLSAKEFPRYASLLESIEDSLSYSVLLRSKAKKGNTNERAKSLVKMLMKNKGN